MSGTGPNETGGYHETYQAIREVVLEIMAERISMTESEMNEPTGPLKGLRILDLTTVLFGPFGTQTLGDWGAEVIKIERLTGDNWRTSGQFRNRGMSGQFMTVNRNKRSIAVDLRHADGKEVLRRLIVTADALVSNIRPAGLERLGFGYETCRAMNRFHIKVGDRWHDQREFAKVFASVVFARQNCEHSW